jgi:hypothetical protein
LTIPLGWFLARMLQLHLPAPRFVKAFLGVIGPNPPGAGDRIPEPLAAMPSWHCATSQWRLSWFGSSAPTLDPPLASATAAWIKGRPFYLSAVPTLDRAISAGLAVLPHAFQNLDGKFAVLAVLQDGAVVCATDLLGHGSIYYCAHGDRLYVSTHLGLLLASLPSPPAYDRLGLASVLATRTWHSGGTPWEGVGRLPAGGYLVIRPRGQRAPEWSACRYGLLEDLLRGEPRSANLDLLVEEYDDLLHRSLRRERYGDRVAVMLSSGGDSSALALALRNGFRNGFGTVTFGSPGSRDLIGGTTLARRLRLASTVAPYDDWDFSTYARHTVSLNGGATGLQEAYMLPGFEHARADFDTAIVGHLGNLLPTPARAGRARPRCRAASSPACARCLRRGRAPTARMAGCGGPASGTAPGRGRGSAGRSRSRSGWGTGPSSPEPPSWPSPSRPVVASPSRQRRRLAHVGG